MSQIDVLGIGELNPDLILSGIRADQPRLGTEQAFDNLKLTLGSSTAITCVIMQRLGLKTAMAACVGDDEHGRFCRDTLLSEGVEDQYVRALAGRNTGVTISLAYPSDRLLLSNYGTMDAMQASDISAQMLSRTRHVHVGSYFIQTGLQPGLADLFGQARQLGVSTSLDTGWDPTGTWLNDRLKEVLASTDVFLPNEVEFEMITGTRQLMKGFQFLHEIGVGEVLLKCGKNGSHYSNRQTHLSHPGFPAPVIDTTGAGDACNAGYITARLAGKPPIDRLAYGNACGALTVGAYGGTSGVAGSAAVESLLASGAAGKSR